MPRNLVLFDLEWNIGYKPYNFNYHGVQQTFRGEIIEIGSALKGRFKTGQRVAGFPYIQCGVCEACQRGDTTFGACTGAKGIGLGQHHGAYAEYVTIGAMISARGWLTWRSAIAG